MNHRHLFLLPLLVGLALPASALADFARPDSTFLATQIAVYSGHRDDVLQRASTPTEFMNAVHQMLVSRRIALSELSGGQRLTRFDDIETQDQMDMAFVRILDEIAFAGIQADTTSPNQEYFLRFADIMGSPPDMGKNPLAFMAITMAEIATITVDTLRADPTFPDAVADQLGLRLIHTATQAHIKVYDDLMTRSGAENFRQKSVIGRMLCEDGHGYRIMSQKNKLHEDGSISTAFYLNCTSGDPFVANFWLEAASRLNKLADRQQLPEKPQPAAPSRGLDP